MASAQRVSVHPGDLVLVPEPLSLVYVQDAGAAVFALQMHSPLTLIDAVAASGCLDSSCGPWTSVAVSRDTANGLQIVYRASAKALFRGGAPIELEPGDLVSVERKGKHAQAVPSFRALYRQAVDAYYRQALRVRELRWLSSGEGVEAVGELDDSMGTVVNLLTGNP